jgi:TonB-dependent starch-binding outer membrane protein SusC
MTNANLTISGGTDASRYSVSGSYFKQDGIVRGTDFDRYSLRFNGDHQVSKKLKVGNSLIVSRTREHPKNTFSPFTSLLILAVTAPPTVTARNPDGSYAGGVLQTDGFKENNPVYEIEVVGQTEALRHRAIGSVFAEYEVLPGLNLRANFGLDFVSFSTRTWNPAVPSTGGQPTAVTSASDFSGYNPSFLAEYTANYQKKLGAHSFNVLAGYTVQESNSNGLGASRSGYQRQDIRVLNDAGVIPTGVSQIGNFNYYSTAHLLSLVGRLSYDFKGKYLVSASLRRDGSSNFGPGNKYATFPAVSLGWNAIDERFLANVPYLTNLKVRASYGQTGNQNVEAFSYVQKINTAIQYPFGDNSTDGGATPGAAPTSIKNPNLRWERNIQSNVGVDIGALSNRINLSVDLYQRESQDLIFSIAPTVLSGVFESTPFNTGTMLNRGVDLTLNTINLPAASPVTWGTTFIFSKYTNEVTSLGLAAPILNGFARINGGGLRVTQGDPVNYFYGYIADGIFQTEEEVRNHATQIQGTSGRDGTSPGDIRFRDINKDGVINDKDRTNIGNSIPNFTYGFTNNVAYKGFDLAVFLQGSSGNKVLNFTRWYTEGGVSNGNYSQVALNRWTGPGTSNEMPRLTQADPNQNNRVSTRFVEDASYLRVKNIRLSYSLPARWVKTTTAAGIRIYGSVQNAITWTKYTGFDPEVGGGVDIGFYPQARTWLGGVTFDF